MNILTWFNKNYPELISEMKNCSHNLSDSELSPYHAEGSVFTHTMMVYSHLPLNASIELKLAALLHDIGKPACAVIREGKGRVSFTNHEKYSSFKAIDIINHYEDESDVFIDKRKILFGINFHDILHKVVSYDEDENVFISNENKMMLNNMFYEDIELFSFLLDLGVADMKGRICTDLDLNLRRYELISHFLPYKGNYIKKYKDLNVYMLIGLPGSGKTTTAEKLMKEDPSLVYLSIDDEIMNLNKYSYSYNGAWSKERQKEASSIVFEKMKKLIEEKKSFILDGTNFQEKIRRRQLNAIPSKYYNKIAMVHLTGEKKLIDVMSSRKDKNVPNESIHNMAKEFLYPSFDMFDSIETFIR